jgi:hypothetical protein
VGVDLGWRLLPGVGLRVAAFIGTVPLQLPCNWDTLTGVKGPQQCCVLRPALHLSEDRTRGTLVIPERQLQWWAKIEDLRGTRDMMFDQVRDYLAGWLRDNPHPDWLHDQTQHLGQWKAPGRLAGVVQRWREKRFDGDSAAFARLEGVLIRGRGEDRDHYEGWHKQDKHLFCWERSLHEKAVAWRNDLYRNFAACLRRSYHTVCLEDIDWSGKLIRLPNPEEEPPLAQVIRRQRFIAAPGRMAQLLEESIAVVEWVHPAYTTERCPKCGLADAFDAARELVRSCRWCDDTLDQDFRAAENLLIASGQVIR